MSVPAFDLSELKVVAEIPSSFGGAKTPIYDFPVSPKEAYAAMLARRPVWQITNFEIRLFAPKIIPDNIARAFVIEASPFNPMKCGGGKDMFGIEWEFVPQAGGSMVRPGNPLLDDANEWRDKIVWPDIGSWDWKGSAQENNDTFIDCDKYVNVWFMNGWFERLISFMGFEGAILALVDEDQTGAVKELFDRLTDLYIRIFDKFITYFPKIDGFNIHDDWGSQRETFFSPAVAEEMIVPYMKRVTDFIHSKGKSCELHSCGQLLRQVPNMIAAGWDCWTPQPMNDTRKIFELYGDKLIIAVMPEEFDPKTTPEEKQREIARAYADEFCHPQKPSYLNISAIPLLTPAFREELYKQSRINYGK
ncbi:MAG: methyltransferase [Clostridiales bacterium]|jgi:hypothetical protein|nr:methyltransferase [Clostridiales bacterium]